MSILNINVNKTLNFVLALLFFVVIVDPTNTVFRLKEILFSFFITGCLLMQKQYSSKILTAILVLFFSFVFSLLHGYLNNYNFNSQECLSFFKSFLFFFILLFTNDSTLHFFNKLTFPCLLISCVTIFIYLIVLFSPEITSIIYAFVISKNNMIMISTRSFLGLDITSIYYKSSPILIILLSYYCYLFFYFSKNKKKHLIYVLLFFITLLCSGTRANMFSAILIICIISSWKIRESFGRPFFITLFLSFIIIVSLFTIKMLSEKEESVEIKGGHLNSMIELFQKDPSIILLGQGPGSLYYSKGVNDYIAISEISYFEIIRMYGIIGGGFILFLFFFPIILLFRLKTQEGRAIGYGYLAYLFIGGTNPLLISSTGIILLATVYSYIYSKKKQII